MGTFFRAFFTIGGLLLAVSLPVIVMAARRDKRATGYRFGATALAIGTFFGIASVVSERLVDDCGRSGSIACLDVGYQGFLLLVAGLFIVTALARAVMLWRS